MPLPDLQAISQAGGWVVAIAVLLGLFTLLIRGDLELGRTHKASLKREDELRAALKEQTEVAKGLVTGIDWLTEHILGRKKADDG